VCVWCKSQSFITLGVSRCCTYASSICNMHIGLHMFFWFMIEKVRLAVSSVGCLYNLSIYYVHVYVACRTQFCFPSGSGVAHGISALTYVWDIVCMYVWKCEHMYTTNKYTTGPYPSIQLKSSGMHGLSLKSMYKFMCMRACPESEYVCVCDFRKVYACNMWL
jgi:hypothetical protein